VDDSGTDTLDAGFEALDAGVAVRPDGGRRPRRRRDAGTSRDAGAQPSEPEPTSRAVPDAGRPVSRDAGPPAERLVYSAALARQILDRRCTECHDLSDIEAHGGDDRAGWSAMLRRMIRQGAELDTEETRVLLQYLTTTYPLSGAP